MVHAEGVGAVPVGDVLAYLLHIDAIRGNTGSGVDAHDRVEQHELEQREPLDLAGDEIPVLGRTGQLERLVANVHHDRAARVHEVGQLVEGAAGDHVGVPALQSLDRRVGHGLGKLVGVHRGGERTAGRAAGPASLDPLWLT